MCYPYEYKKQTEKNKTLVLDEIEPIAIKMHFKVMFEDPVDFISKQIIGLKSLTISVTNRLSDQRLDLIMALFIASWIASFLFFFYI